jgi:hypothetical protein
MATPMRIPTKSFIVFCSLPAYHPLYELRPDPDSAYDADRTQPAIGKKCRNSNDQVPHWTSTGQKVSKSNEDAREKRQERWLELNLARPELLVEKRGKERANKHADDRRAERGWDSRE